MTFNDYPQKITSDFSVFRRGNQNGSQLNILHSDKCGYYAEGYDKYQIRCKHPKILISQKYSVNSGNVTWMVLPALSDDVLCSNKEAELGLGADSKLVAVKLD